MIVRTTRISSIALAAFCIFALQIACAPNGDSNIADTAEEPENTEVAPSPTDEPAVATPTPVKRIPVSDPELAATYRVKVEYWQDGSGITVNATINGGPNNNQLM